MPAFGLTQSDNCQSASIPKPDVRRLLRASRLRTGSYEAFGPTTGLAANDPKC